MDLAQKLISALTELVELKDLKAKIEKPGGWQGTIGPNGLDLGELPKLQAEYARRKEPAWSNARNVLQELKAYGLPQVATEHDKEVIRDIEVIANDRKEDFWPRILAVGALRLIKRGLIVRASSDCICDPFSSRVCQQGTKTCTVDHAAPETSDKICKEPDGCPTELAVLQRFWREVQGQKNA